MRQLIFILGFSCLLLTSVMVTAYPHPGIQPSQIPLDNFTVDQLQQAATAGDPDAQYALGYMNYYGKRVPQNTEMALDWMRRAAVQGQDQAIHALQLLGQSIHRNSATDVTDDSSDDLSTTSTSNTEKSAHAVSDLPNKSASSVVGNQKAKPSDTASTSNKTEKSQTVKASSKTQSYTIQLMASTSKASLEQYSKAHQLGSKVHYGVTQRQGKKWYVLTYGMYSSKSAAQNGLNALPASVKAKHPFVVVK